MALSSFPCLTFDCYGTLIDWESGIFQALQPLTAQLAPAHPLRDRQPLLLRFTHHERTLQSSRPSALYTAVLAAAYALLADELAVAATDQDCRSFAASVGAWPAFPDTLAALRRLSAGGKRKLVILSNVDRDSFAASLRRQLGAFAFDAVYTAQDIGSYKPDPANFRFLVDACRRDLGVEHGVGQHGILHVAQSLFHDHVPARAMGLPSVWIQRGGGNVMGGDQETHAAEVAYSWRFASLGELADAVDADAECRP